MSLSLTDTVTVPDAGDGLCVQLFVCVLTLIQRMSSCITVSVVKTTLPGLRRFVAKAIIFENSFADRMKRNRIVNSGL